MPQHLSPISLLVLTAVLSGCSGADSNAPVGYAPENLGLEPLDQVVTLSDQDHKLLDNYFLTYLQDAQQAGDDANWQEKPYDHYMTESMFK